MPLLFFAAYNAAMTDSIFQWAGQPPKLPHACGESRPYLTYGSLGPRKISPNPHLDRFIGFCRAHERDRHTDTERYADHATPSVAIGRI